MTQLPDDSNAVTSYMSNAARTEAEMKTALEQLHGVIAEIGSKAPETRNISSGATVAPLSSLVLLKSEGHESGTPDILDSMSTSNITLGRKVVVRNADTTTTTTTGDYITINHAAGGSGQLLLADDSDFVLSGERTLIFILTSNGWEEINRIYGRKNAEDIIAERAYLALGSSAVVDVATSSGSSANSKMLQVASGADLATDALLAIDASGNITTGSVVGGNADTLDSLNSTAFVRSNAGTAQSIDASLSLSSSGATTLTANTTSSSETPGVAFAHSGNERGSVFANTADGMVELRSRASGGGAYTASIRLNPATDKIEFNTGPGVGTWNEMWHSGNDGSGSGLDADLSHGISGPFVSFDSAHYFESGEIGLAANSENFTIAHGLGSNPRLIFGFLRCVNDPDLGYTVGSEVPIGSNANSNDSNDGFSYGHRGDNMNLFLVTGANFRLIEADNDGSNQTTAVNTFRWRFVMRAWK